jgi:hypothetical protein
VKSSRFILGFAGAGVLVGAYTIYAVTLALLHHTNPVGVAFVAALMFALSALLLRAASARPPSTVSVRAQFAWIAIVAGIGGLPGLQLGHLTGAVVGAILGVLLGALGMLAAGLWAWPSDDRA